MITANDSVLEAKSVDECPKCHFRNIAFPRAAKTIHVDVSMIYRMKKKYERYMAEM